MGDDFDLFPKRENLDPFSFGRKDKGAAEEKEGPVEDIFGTPAPKTGDQLPDFGLGQPTAPQPPAASAPRGKARPAPPPLDLGPTGPSLPTAEELDRPAPGALAPSEPRGARSKATSKKEALGRKPSPFVLIGGSLLILLLALYGVMTYLKRAKPPAPPPPQASVAVPAPVPKAPPPTPEPKPPAAEAQVPAQTPAAQKAAPTPAAPEQTRAAEPAKAVQPVPPPAPRPAAATAPEPKSAVQDGYTVQVGSLILKASVRDLESKLKGLGYEPFEGQGTTTARMNHLTVGPFDGVAAAQAAAARLKGAGIEAEVGKRAGGKAVVFAGSYLKRENAEEVMGKVRSLGYSVQLTEREAQLPLTSVRVGRYATAEEANAARDKLKGQGFEPVVVRLK